MADFLDFWKQYPRKIAKRVAEKSWQKLSTAEQEAALDALPSHLEFWRKAKTEQTFIPHASTWLNQGRWEDEIEIPAKQNTVKIAWWSSEQETIKKAQEIGVHARGGEGWGEFRQRIAKKLKAA